MTRILVQPDLLHQLSKEFQTAAHQINDVKNRLHGAMGSLSWEVRQRFTVDEKWNAAHNLGTNITAKSQEFANRLTQSAQAFHERDAEGVQQLAKAVAASMLQSGALGALLPGGALIAAVGTAALSMPQGDLKNRLAELGKSALTPIAKLAVLRTLINFTPGSNPNVYNISSKVAGTKLASSYARYIANPLNKYLPGPIAKLVPNSLSGVMKKVVGLSENFNRASAAGISQHLLKNAVKKIPVVSALFNFGGAGVSIYDSYQKHKNLERDEFWKNFSADSASSIWKATLQTAGGWAGTAIAVALTWETGPGAVAAGIGGNYLGTKAGEWVADKTDAFVRDVGEFAGEMIPKAIDKTVEVAHDIKNGVASIGKKIDDGIKSLFKVPFFA